MIERATDGVALLAVLSWMNPSVLAWLSDVSQLAALATPILGFAWLAIRLCEWTYKKLRATETSNADED
jgi:hypothetical protein